MSAVTDFLVSKSGQMSVPANVRRRWGLSEGGRVTVVDLGEVVVLLPAGSTQKLLGNALSADEHLAFVRQLEDPDLATT
jgi:AbrB family looped-hinge helix DNA binding protein